MDRLWAPWRIGYIKNIEKKKGCLFCRAHRSSDDKKKWVIRRSRHSLAMLNLYPYNNGHVMVAPARHVSSIESLGKKEAQDLMTLVTQTKLLLDRALRPQGYNIGVNIGRAAGAGIDQHIHVHIVPRWRGDTNFMASLFDTKVISQSLDALYRELLRNNKRR